MSLVLTAEQEAALERSVRKGNYASACEALDAAVRTLDSEASPSQEERSRLEMLRSKSLFDLMQESPLYGLDLEFSRDRSPMRDIDL